MNSELVVSNITPAGDSGTVTINGSLKANSIVPPNDSEPVTIAGDFQAGSLLGSIKHHHVIRRLTFPLSSGKQTVDFGLLDTNAKYILANVFAYTPGNGDYVNIFLGKSLPDIDSNNNSATRGSDFFNLDDNELYTAMTIYYGCVYGINEFLIIPLCDDGSIFVKTYDHELQNVYVKIKTIGYIE